MSKSKQPPPLAEAQLEIMNVVWDRGEATVGQIWRVLSARRRMARNTIQTTVTRLEEKGWLRHRTEGNVFVYSAAVARQATLRRMVRQLVDTAFSGSAEGLVMTLLSDRGLSPDEAERIRHMLAKPPGKRSRKK
jgi:predicted transcriptional regulator